jgi:hypothetical protein
LDLDPAEIISKSRSKTDPFQAKTKKIQKLTGFRLKRIRFGSGFGHAFRRIQILINIEVKSGTKSATFVYLVQSGDYWV